MAVRVQRVVLTGASSVPVKRYCYRGSKIPTPWALDPPAVANGCTNRQTRGAPGAVRVARRVRRAGRETHQEQSWQGAPVRPIRTDGPIKLAGGIRAQETDGRVESEVGDIQRQAAV